MKKIRMILPALAIIFAIAGAFATNATPSISAFAPVNVSLDGGNCNIDGTCEPGGTLQCQSGSTDLDQVIAGCPNYTVAGVFTPVNP